MQTCRARQCFYSGGHGGGGGGGHSGGGGGAAGGGGGGCGGGSILHCRALKQARLCMHGGGGKEEPRKACTYFLLKAREFKESWLLPLFP